MNKYVFVLLFFIISGCTSIPVEQSSVLEKNLTPISQIRIGMTYQEAASIMGEGVVVGFTANPQAPDEFAPSMLKHPYRKETLNIKGKVYDIVYYFTQIKKAEGIVAEDELTPLIFQNNKLIGKGEDFLRKLKGS